MNQTFDRSASMREHHAGSTPEQRRARTAAASAARRQLRELRERLAAENAELRAENERLRSLVAA